VSDRPAPLPASHCAGTPPQGPDERARLPAGPRGVLTPPAVRTTKAPSPQQTGPRRRRTHWPPSSRVDTLRRPRRPPRRPPTTGSHRSDRPNAVGQGWRKATADSTQLLAVVAPLNSKPWDGVTLENQDQLDAYVWVATYKGCDGVRRTSKGTITILR
jgi:hypothetical protein